ncbi:hypothetical protein O3G_MSEX009605 [Manduca sexta]|uniref:Uncharacterized protein n=1 Tax=Manduca sexta TaxID=7130 RepID=A0A921ZE55_MANSE|nr:hypothetical protein O3G_MSEX009605 [Manduca sexta]
MSEQIELDDSNLCISEDAFEKFQAISMYEENEYITLTNVVPTQPPEGSLGDNTKMESSDDAMVNLNTDGEVYVNTQKCPGEPQSPQYELAENCDSTNVIQPPSGESNNSAVTSKHVYKRDRKNKTITESGENISENYSESVNIVDSTNEPAESIEDIQNFIRNTEPELTPKRRGRKPKHYNISADVLSGPTIEKSKESNIDTLVPPLKTETSITYKKRLPRRRVQSRRSPETSITNISSSNEDKLAVVDITNQSVSTDTSEASKRIMKKRGRPKKTSDNIETNQIQSTNIVDNPKSPDILDSLQEAPVTKQPKKRGRPRKNRNTEQLQGESGSENNVSSHNTSLECDDDDICLSNISKMVNKKPDSVEGIDNEDKIELNDLLEIDNNTKHTENVKKRGRPKKILPEPVSQECDKKKSQEDSPNNKKLHEDGDDVSLSEFKKALEEKIAVHKLEETSDTKIIQQSSEKDINSTKNDEQMQCSSKRNSKMPIMSDFEYNLDNVVIENKEIENTDSQKDDYSSLLVEDTSRRPTRKKIRKTLQYHEDESDEDPFANVELSDDEPRKKRKGRRYNSDDEYFPGDRTEPATPSSSDSESNIDLDTDKRNRKRKSSKKADSQSPRKKGRKPITEKTEETGKTSDQNNDDDLITNDIEDCLHSSVIKTNDETSKAWGTTKEFENFLAKKIQGTNLKIKKVSSSENADTITPLQIPTIDTNEAKKTIEMCSQTTKISTSNIQVQTGCIYDVPMKETVKLTAEQSAKSCEFLTSIVNTTAELGKLMTQKSEDFIKKKINTDHVTDTFKMDYCVRKSFLLFKLAKHNLTQMEEDLANQYEQFLHKHDLLKYREEPKTILPTAKADSDSDCEIVEVPQEEKVKKTSISEKFNPKTVFLNKELSIKIAKKPTDDKKINIKGKHTVWISDSVMVKKVKPTQSFLAQDSRNKKPPDQKYVTAEMVRDFFEDYYRKKTLATCALFTSPQWLKLNNNYICNYFVTKQGFAASTNNNETATFALTSANTSASATDMTQNMNTVKGIFTTSETISPEPLMTLCTKVLQTFFHTSSSKINTINSNNNQLEDASYNIKEKPKRLMELCINVLNFTNDVKDKQGRNGYIHQLHEQVPSKKPVPTLKSLCHKKVTQLLVNTIASHESIYKCDNYLENTNLHPNNNNIVLKEQKNIKSLFSLCTECFNFRNDCSVQYVLYPDTKQQGKAIQSLFSLCVESIRHIHENSNKNLETCLKTEDFMEEIMPSKIRQNKRELKSLITLCVESINLRMNKSEVQTMKPVIKQCSGDIKTLFSLCVECIQNIQMAQKNRSPKINIQMTPSQLLHTPQSLKKICFKYMLGLLFNNEEFTYMNQDINTEPLYSNNDLTECFTINSVNTLSEEAFHSLQNTAEHHLYQEYDNEESYLSNDDFEPPYEETEEYGIDDNNWASQVQMKELRSCANINNLADTHNILNGDGLDTLPPVAIKTEPIEDVSENVLNSITVKIEPMNELDEMIMIPDSVVTKAETSVNSQITDHSPRPANISYSAETFEEFVRRSKLMYSLDDEGYREIYSQSSSRVRRQFEPDYDEMNDGVDGLLVPHTYTNIYSAKDCLMASSSDENNIDKNAGKKRPSKRKVKPKKTATKSNSKDVAPPVKEKSNLGASEVDELTRKMKDRIRQEENDRKSSESELEDLPLGKRRNKGNGKDTNKKPVFDKSAKDAIQCNDVDSTEPIDNSQTSVITNDAAKISSNSVEKNNSSNITDKIRTHRKKNLHTSCNFKGPLELLECEPTIHVDGNDDDQNLAEILNESISDGVTKSNGAIKESNNEVTKEQLAAKEGREIVDRCGWSCYPINTKDTKLYQEAFVLLDKLPESFVQTYLQYQEITEHNEVDREIDRLINVNSLNRLSKEKAKSKLRSKVGVTENSKPSQKDTSPIHENTEDSEQVYEFAPSDDDGANFDDELLPPVPQRNADNVLAKSSLMNDESDDEGRTSPKQVNIKQEHGDAPVKKRPGPRSKTRAEPTIPEGELVLTADKMMKEELTLLHAPVNMDSTEVNDVDTTHKELVIRTRSKTHKKMQHTMKIEDDSSSEEEKQWVSTKEKLLKRLKKAPDASVSDAKRAKMVTEFIEKRGDGTESRKVSRAKYRGSKKKFLEREKQLKVLSKELYGETSSDAVHPRKSYMTTMNYKGRRNIRKVIDKKSLEISTLKANIEELERKRRLNERQNRLREHLGCDDNVNVLVINDEVCLEYDFDEDQPVVTVHAFFTKVMKAHQYEGVKFMWDACFESLSKIGSGHPGGGCILAHCMGLGKTLQVLALLHTVLTHPQVGMKRVLVCCPLSTVLNWVDEIHKWIGPVTDQLKVFELSKLKKTYERAYQLEDWYNGGGIFIIGYELFRSLTTLDPVIDHVRPTIVKKIRKALLDPGPDIVVCDEGHLLKNDCSVLAVAMSRVATRRRIVLTGTPMQNNLREYYCMVNFIKPNLLGSYAEYSNRFANPIMNGQHRDSSEEDIKLMKTRTHILHKVLEGCLQRQEASVLYPYLPKKHEYTVFIPLTKCQWDLYKHYLYTYCKQNKQGILKDFHILQKIWSHPQVLHNFHTKLSDYKRTKEEKLEDDLAAEDLSVDDIKPTDTEVWWLQYLDGGNMLECLESSNKFVAVFRILNECVTLGDKVLIFSTSLFCLDTLEYFLKKINCWSLGQEYYRLDGSVPPEVRHKWCREFNADNNVKTKLFLISTRAGSLGLNMTAANRVIILDTSWNPAHDMQSIFRVYRFGQKKDCFIYRLVAMGTMEQKIYERSVTKQAVACRVVDEQQIDRHYNSADLAELYRLDEAGGSVSGGVAAGVRDVALLRVARDGPVHAVHEHDSLLRASEPALPEHERAAAWHQFQLERAAQPTNVPTTKKGKISTKSLQNAKSKTTQEQNENDSQEPQTSKDKDVVNCCIPIKSEKPVFFTDNDIKNEIANDVVHTLIKQNFPNMQAIKDVTAVVTIVKNIVENVQTSEQNKTVATMVITKSMFAHAHLPLSKLLNKVSHNLNANIEAQMKQLEQPVKPEPEPPKKSERLKEKEMGRQLRSRSKLTEEPLPQPKKRTKTKKKAVVASELTNEQWDNKKQSSGDSSATVSADESVTLTEKPGPLCKKTYIKAAKKIQKLNDAAEQPVTTDNSMPGTTNNSLPVTTDKSIPVTTNNNISVTTDNSIPLTTDNSILLSDDDDVTIVQTSQPLTITTKTAGNVNPKPVQVQKTPTAMPKSKQIKQTGLIITETQSLATSKGKAVTETRDSEPVPLHPSLLTNKNFITIVAHKYLEATPLLDEDAATLAAQYSTQKAKKEMEETGKSITSGPLYDIAVNLLGIETLEKLNRVTPKVTKAKKAEAAATLQLQESVIDVEKTGASNELKPDNTQLTKQVAKPKPAPKQTTKKDSNIKEHKLVKPVEKPPNPTVPAVAPQHTAPVVTSTTSNVVPVELFKGPSIPTSSQYPQQNYEECILPDDDDSPSIVAETPLPPPQNPVPVKVATAKTVSNQKKKKPIILRTALKIDTKSSPGLQPALVQVRTAGPQNVTVGGLRGMISTVGGKIVVDASQLDNTICLDSDDEETAAPAGPVPVALTRVNASQVMPITRVTTSHVMPITRVTTSQVMPITRVTTSQVMPITRVTTSQVMSIPRVNAAQVMPITRVVASAAPILSSGSCLNVSAASATNNFSNPVALIGTPVANTSLLYTVNTSSNSFVSTANNSPAILAVSAPSPSFSTPIVSSPISIVSKPVSCSSSPHKADQASLPNTSISDDSNLTIKAQKSNQFILKINNQTLKLVQTTPPPDSVKTIIKLGKNDILIPNALDKEVSVSKETMNQDHSSASTRPSTRKVVPIKPAQSVNAKKIVEASTSRRSSSVCLSSDSDTPSSSNAKRDDPLDILKDIVHIQAYTNENDQNEKSLRNKGKTTQDISSSSNKAKTLQTNSKTTKEVKASNSEKKGSLNFRQIAAKPNTTDLVLRFSTDAVKSLNKKLTTTQASSSKPTDKSTMKAKEILNIKLDNPKAKSNTKSVRNVIDLTSYCAVEPNKSKDTKNSKKTTQDKLRPAVINLTDNVVCVEKPLLELAKNALTTVDITGEPSRPRPATRAKSVAQHTPTNDKKRSSTTVDTKSAKKKKVKELTLQDFDIDDLDDIIELE